VAVGPEASSRSRTYDCVIACTRLWRTIEAFERSLIQWLLTLSRLETSSQQMPSNATSLNALERVHSGSAHSGKAFEADRGRGIRSSSRLAKLLKNSCEGCLGQGSLAVVDATSRRSGKANWPNRRVQSTPLRVERDRTHFRIWLRLDRYSALERGATDAQHVGPQATMYSNPT